MNKNNNFSPSAITRFAPSPTGYLHLGHAYSAMFAERAARKTGGRFFLRIEDIDQERCKQRFESAIYEDLEWLGLTWSGTPLRQSERSRNYREALDHLVKQDLVYPCFCSRKEIRAELKGIVNAPHGPDGYHYPGTCRKLGKRQQQLNISNGEPYALRLNSERAGLIAGPLKFFDVTNGYTTVNPSISGDIILGRKEMHASYHLAVTIDDAAQGINLVTRGEDLMPACHIQRLLQELLGLPETLYHHHRIIKDHTGRRLAKRNKSKTLRSLRHEGFTPECVSKKIGLNFPHGTP